MEEKEIKESIGRLRYKNMLNEGLITDSMLDDMIGPAAVFEVEGETLRLLRMNRHYEHLVYISDDHEADIALLISRLSGKYFDQLMAIGDDAKRNMEEGTCGTLYLVDRHGKMVSVESKVFCLYSDARKSTFFTSLKTMQVICPCCHKPGVKNFYEICPFCGWENDPIQMRDPDFSGGANRHSLNEYRKNYEAVIKVNPNYRWSDR